MRSHGEGTVYQRDNGKWRAQISVGGERITKGGFDTKREATKWKRKMLFKMDQGFDPTAGKMKLKDYLHFWFESHKETIRPKTAHQYNNVINKHLIPYLGEISLKDLGLPRIENHYSELSENSLGNRTVQLVHAVLHRALKQAVRYEYIIKNPAHGANVPKVEKREMQVLDENEVIQFLIAARESSHYALYYLAVKTGMRQGELFGLQWKDLDWVKGKIQVRRQVTRVPRQGWDFSQPKTQSGVRSIAIGENTLDVLRAQRQQVDEWKAIAGDTWEPYDLIFPSHAGTPLYPSNVRRDYNKVLGQAGFERIRFHDLRHTAASLMLNQGIPVIVVSNILGHSKASITLDIYGHLIHGIQEEAAKVMDEIATPVRVDLPEKKSVGEKKEK